jgi:regulatory protein
MAGKITSLEYQKKNPKRVSVFLDERFAFGLPEIVAARLARGQFLSDAQIEDLKNEGTVETAYNKTLDFLSFRPRSRAELESYLQKRGLSSAEAEATILRLERAGLVDDLAFAEFWVENRERFRPRGLRALRYELRQKGIGERIIEQVLAGISVSESAYRSASKKARQFRHLDRQAFQQKMVPYLARRGFDYDVAREAVDRLWTELSADEL